MVVPSTIPQPVQEEFQDTNPKPLESHSCSVERTSMIKLPGEKGRIVVFSRLSDEEQEKYRPADTKRPENLLDLWAATCTYHSAFNRVGASRRKTEGTQKTGGQQEVTNDDPLIVRFLNIRNHPTSGILSHCSTSFAQLGLSMIQGSQYTDQVQN